MSPSRSAGQTVAPRKEAPRRGILLRRTLLLVLATLLLSALLTTVVYFGFSTEVFASIKASELEPRAQSVADLVVSVRRGDIPASVLYGLVDEGPSFWDALILIYDMDGNEALGLYPDTVPSNVLLLDMLAPRVKKAIAGEKVVEIQRTWPFISVALIVGTPIVDDGRTVGAVLMVKPMTEMRAAMGGLNRTLLLSMSAAFLLMLIPSYLAARKMIRPIRKMQAAADAMACGDFSVRAEERQKGELGGLAQSLNRLSTELSKTIGELTRERNSLALVLDGLSEGIAAVDAEGRAYRTNPALSVLAGSEAADAAEPLRGAEAGERAIDRIPGLRADFARVLADGGPIVREAASGGRTLRVSVSPLHESQDRVSGAVALVRDTTESARLEKARRDYVSNISHEFRTPVSSLRGLLEPLRDGLVTGEEDRIRYYSFMLRETERLTRLIDDLLELSRLQSGTVAFESRPFRLSVLLDEVGERFHRVAEEKSIRLDVEPLPEGAPAVHGNPDRVDQVLVVLVDNALKFTPPGGAIRISASLEPSRYVVSVQDDGQGIRAEDLPQVFERFYKADGSHSGQGSGLGLAIAREVLRHMGQEISVRNEPGHGARFSFTLARADLVKGDGGGP